MSFKGLLSFTCFWAALALVGCKKSEKPAQTDRSAPAASSTAAPAHPAPRTLVVPAEEITKTNNPKGTPPYAGPTGTVSGVVRLTGDAVPELPELKKKMPRGKCLGAPAVHGVLLREGDGRGVADVLVAITGYEGFVVPREMSQTVTVKNCALSTRTVAMTFGQTLEIENLGPEAVTPQLIGSPAKALLVAIPGGKPLSFTPPKPGRYQLVDRSHDFASADVYVLSYPTAAVTDTAGHFRIDGIPVGKAKLNAFLPQTGQTISQEVNVESGQELKLELKLAFDKNKHVTAAPVPAEEL